MDRIRLLSMTVSGIKNIKEPITIEFSRTKDYLSLPCHGDNIRAIYGPNACGKTAIALAFWAVAFIVGRKHGLASHEAFGLKKLINFEAKSMNISLDFGAFQEDEPNQLKLKHSYRYELSVVIRKNGGLLIFRERFSEFSGKQTGSRLLPVFETSNGKLERLWTPASGSLAQAIMMEGSRTFGRQSFFSFFASFLKKNKAFKSVTAIPESLSYAATFLQRNLMVSVPCMPPQRDAMLEDERSEESKMGREAICPSWIRVDPLPIKIPKSQIRSFEAFLKRKTKFIRLFKPSLKDIFFEKKEDGGFCLCTEKLNYGAYSVDIDSEGSGLRRLIELFPYIDATYRGGVAVIDEFDVGLSGVYLEKLVRFLNEYGDGQLLFTAHSLEAMKALADHGKSIYFLSPSNKIYSWKKNAHYKPYILYPEGMIGDIDFDIEPFDLIEALSSK